MNFLNLLPHFTSPKKRIEEVISLSKSPLPATEEGRSGPPTSLGSQRSARSPCTGRPRERGETAALAEKHSNLVKTHVPATPRKWRTEKTKSCHSAIGGALNSAEGQHPGHGPGEPDTVRSVPGLTPLHAATPRTSGERPCLTSRWRDLLKSKNL